MKLMNRLFDMFFSFSQRYKHGEAVINSSAARFPTAMPMPRKKRERD